MVSQKLKEEIFSRIIEYSMLRTIIKSQRMSEKKKKLPIISK